MNTVLVPLDGRDAAYAAVPTPDVTGVNLDDEPVPTLPHVWGGSGSGGCGLTGLEAVLLLVLARFRSRAKKQTG